MARNLYQGTDLTPVIQAPSPQAFVLAVANAYDEAQSSDFAARANAWATEIAVTRPDLIGLNEAVQWRTGPANGVLLDATTDAGDFLQLLLSALATRGLHYQVAAKSTGFDVEAPGLFQTGLMDVRVTQHEAILARTDGGLTLTNPQADRYATFISVPSVVGPFPLPWSWASVDVTKHGKTFRFATTHLDSISGAAQAAQAQEFLSGPGATTLPAIWVGDFNSDANAQVTGVVPNTRTYGDVIAAGFRDSWAATRPGNPGYTCCQAHDLLNLTSTLDTRIDFVFTRGPISPVLNLRVGSSVLERLLYGRWPSDHAGVLAVLKVQPS
jgi:hypothetical protein